MRRGGAATGSQALGLGGSFSIVDFWVELGVRGCVQRQTSPLSLEAAKLKDPIPYTQKGQAESCKDKHLAICLPSQFTNVDILYENSPSTGVSHQPLNCSYFFIKSCSI